VLRELNRWIDKTYHSYFEDPDKCLQAVFLDMYAHQAVESILGLPPREIAKRTSEILPKNIGEVLERDHTQGNKIN